MAWNPKKTVSEIKKDPWRAARASATGGASEIPNVINANPSLKTAEKKLATPKLNIEDVLKPQNIENPYAEAAKQAMQQNVLPDFAQAQATAGQQGAFAKALQDLYGAGAGQMTGLMSNLQRQMSGDFGPGGALAQKVLEQGLSQNVAGVRSQLASQRGLNPALAARYAAQQTAQLGGQTAQQAGILGLQQQLAAQQQLGQLAGTSATLGAKAGDIFGQMRGQDITQAQATSDAALKRLGTLVQSDVGMRQIQAQTGMAENEIRQKVASANQAAAAGDRQLAAQIIGSLIGAGGQIGAAKATGSTAAPAAAGAGGAGAAAASDERTKKNIKNISDKDINEFLNSVNPVSYEYKEPEKYGQGDKAGFLMQDVADTKIGQMIQRPLPDGKMGYDPQSLQGVILAALARRNKAEGGRIDGTAPYAGDTPKNDIVPANLSPGEIVIPRSAAGSKKDAKSFIEALDDWDESEGYSKVLKARQKKNYFDGGVVDQDKELLAKSNREYFQQMNQEIPAIKSFKERLDEGLGKYVVDPMARDGYPTLGAALATVPSTAAEFLLPGSPAEMAGPLIPFPGAKLAKQAEKVLKEQSTKTTRPEIKKILQREKDTGSYVEKQPGFHEIKDDDLYDFEDEIIFGSGLKDRLLGMSSGDFGTAKWSKIKLKPEEEKFLASMTQEDWINPAHVKALIYQQQSVGKEFLSKMAESAADEPYMGSFHNETWRTVPGLQELNLPQPLPQKVKDLKGVLGKEVPQGGADPFQWLDSKYGVTKKLLEKNTNTPLTINTRSDLIANDDYMKLLNPSKHKINIHLLGDLDVDRLARFIEPGAPSIRRRLAAAQKLVDAGFDVTLVKDVLQHKDMPAELQQMFFKSQPTGNFKVKQNVVNVSDKGMENIKKMIGDNFK